MPIIPDDKDWTWVLSRPCPECGFNAASVTPATAATTIPALLPRWQQALRRAGVDVRPDDSTWSVLEYAAHVRDVFDVFTGRLELMLANDDPTFPNWDQDRAALDGNYASLDPDDVARELVQNGEDAAAAFAAVAPGQWNRRGLRSNGSEFTVLTLSGYFMHDLIHHLHDVNA
ncbi:MULTISPECIES: DinB family protein [unclassified Arthrobacter]|uniref:DinB family protein n=1 Tax=unclassified Arthrobacter TaxID=235627 RepID=UPI00159EB226|nr:MULTISPECIES: DinB family protein [unclassified Arthrobacter]MCQ9164091.1 DinB family protein [Arthrobacter sp. STN4]NVM97887.1 DinB family protein [Arthrobacter sp. SDTb3-6]